MEKRSGPKGKCYIQAILFETCFLYFENLTSLNSFSGSPDGDAPP